MPASKNLEQYQEWERGRTSIISRFQKSLQPIHVIALTALVLYGYWLIDTNKADKNLVIGAVIGVVLILAYRNNQGKEKHPIPEPTAKILATQAMEEKIRDEYPMGTRIIPLPYCKLRYQGYWGTPFTPWKWEVGFRVEEPDGSEEEMVVILAPYDGYVTGIVKRPSGYTGEDSKDLSVLMPTQLTVKEDKAK